MPSRNELNARSANPRQRFAILAGGLVVVVLLFISSKQRQALFQRTSLTNLADPSVKDRQKSGADPRLVEDLEATNRRIIGVFVVDKSGQPVAKAKVQVRVSKWRENGWRLGDDKCFTTDASGFAEVDYPVQRISSSTEIHASCNELNLGGKRIRWEHSWEIPATCTITLGRTVNFGGAVVDENGSPIAGAEVRLFRFLVDAVENYRPELGEHFDFPIQSVTTDGWGRWSARGVPLALIDRIGFAVSHPDFVSCWHSTDLNSDRLDALLIGDFQVKLRRGVLVRGVVQDDAGAPVQGATVQLDHTEQQTDAAGRFTFANLRDGSHPIIVSAKGYAIENRPIKIASGMDEVVIQLQRGHIIRGLVRDEAGAVLAGVHIQSESFDHDWRSASNYAAVTDQAGQFLWDTAPAPPPTFRFWRPGFVMLRNLVLVPDTDNLITLHKLADLEGTVLDDVTGEPIKRFRVALRNRYRQDAHTRPAQEFSGEDGRFKLARDSDSDEIGIRSDDYESFTGWISSAQNVAPSAYRLAPKKNSALCGLVVSPDGRPIPGVRVTRAGSSSDKIDLKLKPGRFGSSSVRTDDRGQFCSSSAHSTTVIYATSASGFGQITAGDIENGQPLVLRPFGRLRGTLFVDGQPAPRQWVEFRTRLPGLHLAWPDNLVRTDEDGDFTFDQLPPGPGIVVRYRENDPVSDEDEVPPVQIRSGETSVVTVRDYVLSDAGK